MVYPDQGAMEEKKKKQEESGEKKVGGQQRGNKVDPRGLKWFCGSLSSI